MGTDGTRRTTVSRWAIRPLDEAEAVLKPVVQADEPTWSRARVNALWRPAPSFVLQGDSQGALSRLEQALAHTSKRPRGESIAARSSPRWDRLAPISTHGAAIEPTRRRSSSCSEYNCG